MNPLTNGVSTRDWVEVSKDMAIVAYIESRTSIPIKRQTPFTEEDFEAALKKLIGPVERQPTEKRTQT